MVDGPVKLQDALPGKSGLLKLPVHVRSRHESREPALLDPGKQQRKPFVGDGIPIQVAAVPVKAPAKARIALEMLGVGGVHETEAELGIGGIGAPETAVAAKVREPGIDPHACPRRHHQRLGRKHQLCRSPELLGKIHGLHPKFPP